MREANQIEKKRLDVNVTAADLLEVPTGTRSEEGLRHNILVGIQYVEAWLRGTGCVPLYNLMEDAATAEISRAQVWQWLRHGAELTNGRKVTRELLAAIIPEEMDRIRSEVGDAVYENGRYEQARDLFHRLCVAEEFDEFLTLPAYDLLLAIEEGRS
jgi:malate synthase